MAKEQLFSTETLVGKEPMQLRSSTTSSLPPTNRAMFLKSCDKVGRSLFEEVLKLAETNDLNIIWGSKGFSLRADLSGTLVTICQGYPPQVWFGQSLYTFFGDITKKVRDGSKLVEEFRKKLEDTGVFVSAGQKQSELKWEGSSLTEETIERLTHLLGELAAQVKKQGLSE